MITIQNYIVNLFTPELLEAIGWTIIHSLWQGALVAVLLTIVLNTLKHNASTNRYVVSVTALFAMLQISLFTFFTVYEPHADFSHLTAPSAIIGNEIPNFAANSGNLGSENLSIRETSISEDIAASIQFVKQGIANNLNYVVILWFIGVSLFTIRFLGGLLYVNRLKTKMVGLAPEKWQIMANEISHKLRLRKSVRVLLSDLVSVPTAIGIFRPVILMPISLQTGLSMQEVESILAHELAHIRRNDYLINIFQSVAEILFFYHPAMWWISGIIRDERENCCDDMAVSILGDSLVYSRTLARMNELNVQQTYTQTALAFNGKKGSLLGRIKRLFGHKNENNVLAERFAAVTIILAAMLVSLTANASLVANKAVQLVREVQASMPVSTHSENITTSEYDEEFHNSMKPLLADGLAFEDTTKKKPKMFITIDENGKADTVILDNKNSKFQFYSFGDGDAFAPMPPMPPEMPMPPMPPMPPMNSEDFNFDYENYANDGNTSVQVINGKNGKTVIINGKEIDIADITKNAKTVNVDNENGKVRIIVDGKVAKTIDVDKIRESVMTNFNKHYYHNSSYNSKSFDSLKNTKEYKKKREKYEKALKDYQELMKEYENKLPKDKSGNFKNTEEWRAYADAQRDYQEAIREQQEDYEQAIREQQQEAREQQQEVREQQREAIREKRMAERDRAMAERDRARAERDQVRAEQDQVRAEREQKENDEKLAKIKVELVKDGFKTKKFSIKVNAKGVEINDTKLSPELEQKYRKLFGWSENQEGTMTMEHNED